MNEKLINNLSDFLINSKSFHYEAELLTAFFLDKDYHSLTNIELYKSHFQLFHSLYTLKPILAEKGYYLHIHFMRIGVVPFPSKDKCRYFDEVKLIFCENIAVEPISDWQKGYFCQEHNILQNPQSLDIIDSKEYFYLDKSNLDFFSEEILENWLSGMNIALKDNDYFSVALSLLHLENSFDIDSLKAQYRALAKKHHPDLSKESHDKFLEINRAYQFLLKCIRQ